MPSFSRLQTTGLILGPVIFLSIIISPSPASMEVNAWRTAAVALLMAAFWITEAIPISATALFPVILFPLLGITSIKNATEPYAHYLVFLFLGGFLIAQSIQKWGLHKRIALTIIRVIGFNAKSIIAGFMISCAFLSMWISNTATALMMLPIGISIITLLKNSETHYTEKEKTFALVLMLGIAYSCSIGGVGTLIGTPPNALMAAYLRDNFDIEITFVNWMKIGLPFILVGLPAVFILLTKFIYPVTIDFKGAESIIRTERESIGKLSYQEKMTSIVFGVVALLWIFQPLFGEVIKGLNDTTIAISGAIALFFIPSRDPKSKTLLDWNDAEKISWGILILFGGGLSLANGIQSSGLAVWLGNLFSESVGIPSIVIILLLVTLIIFLTELTSNLATTAAFIPVVSTIAMEMHGDPLTFVIPTTIAASCAFMLPVATPPNAIIFSTGEIKIPQMAKAGIFLNLTFVVIIIVLSSLLSRFLIY